jgi:hypothetical protein
MRERNYTWQDLWGAVAGRLRSAYKNPLFVFHILVAVFLVSGIGVWLPFISALINGKSYCFFDAGNILTYCAALIGMMLIDILMSEDKLKDNILVLPGTFLALLTLVFLFIGYAASKEAQSHFLIPIGFFMTILLYFLSNSQNEEFTKPQSTPTGNYDVNEDMLTDTINLERNN